MSLFGLQLERYINFKSSTSHKSSYFRHYSAHHSSSHLLMPGARTQRSPGSFHQSCWAGCHPRTCSITRNTGVKSPQHTHTHHLQNDPLKKECSRCGQWGSIHPLPLAFQSSIRQSNPDLFVASEQVVEESL